MKVAVANSSEMIWSNPNQLISALSRSFVPVLFCNVAFLEALPPLEEHKDGLGMFLVAYFQSVSILASRKDLIARLPLRLWPAKMTLVFVATFQRMVSI